MILILCAGSQERFEGDIPKQLMPVCGKPLLLDILHKVKPYRDNTLVVTHNQQIIDFCNLHHVKILRPNKYDKVINTLNSTRHLWNERIKVLLGDVYYESEVLSCIFNCNRNLCVVANYDEIFGLSFTNHIRLSNAINVASNHPQGKLWHFYRAYSGIPLSIHARDKEGILLTPDDSTNDIDTIEEYQELLLYLNSK